MKKITAILMAFTLLLSLAAFTSCGGNEDQNTPDSTEEITEAAETMQGGEEFANDNEAIYKDSWK